MAVDLPRIVSAGAFPLWGGMRDLVSPMLHLGAKHSNMAEWGSWSVVDPTCGSCATSASFAAYGMRPVVSDLAMRSVISARAIFGGRRMPPAFIFKLLEAKDPVPAGKRSAEEVSQGFLLPEGCRVFDCLFWAAERGDVSVVEAAFAKFLAIRWIMELRPGMRFMRPPTTDLRQLALQSMWTKVCQKLDAPVPVLFDLADKVWQLIQVCGNKANPWIDQGDAFEVVQRMPWGRHNMVSCNPPTTGNETFELTNRVLDSLLENEWRKPTKDAFDPVALWVRLVARTLQAAPGGSLVLTISNGAISAETVQAQLDAHDCAILETIDFPSKGLSLMIARK